MITGLLSPRNLIICRLNNTGRGSWRFGKLAKDAFVLTRSGPDHSSGVSGSIGTATIPYQRRRAGQRAKFGAAGTALVLMGIAMGVLTIRFALVLAHDLWG